MDAVHDSALELLNSEKFRNWNWRIKRIIIGKSADSETLDIDRAIRPRRVEKSNLTKDRALEKHYSASEVAEVWGVSVDLVRNVFRQEPDVLALDRTKRGKYVTLRIPESVMIRVHRRLSQG
jgi:hypothetical protein